MSNRAKKTRNGGPKTAAVLLAVCGLSLVGGVYAYMRSTPGALEVPMAERKVDPRGESDKTSQTARHTKTEVEVVSPHYDGEDLKFSREKHPVAKTDNPYLKAVNGFLDSNSVAPKDARLKDAKMDGPVLVLNFSPSFETTYGTDDERTLINGIIESVKQFEGVRAVRIMVDGHRIETLGNIDLTEDLAVAP
ncbi:MAG: GerMN domain-containing protein [Armatimonadetes bacterium]|nr:GerMN domain-containing protein [Armatimonadota bacterium]